MSFFPIGRDPAVGLTLSILPLPAAVGECPSLCRCFFLFSQGSNRCRMLNHGSWFYVPLGVFDSVHPTGPQSATINTSSIVDADGIPIEIGRVNY